LRNALTHAPLGAGQAPPGSLAVGSQRSQARPCRGPRGAKGTRLGGPPSRGRGGGICRAGEPPPVHTEGATSVENPTRRSAQSHEAAHLAGPAPGQTYVAALRSTARGVPVRQSDLPCEGKMIGGPRRAALNADTAARVGSMASSPPASHATPRSFQAAPTPGLGHPNFDCRQGGLCVLHRLFGRCGRRYDRLCLGDFIFECADRFTEQGNRPLVGHATDV
jgi:hypothetical protein